MTNYTTLSLTASVKSLVFILSILGTSTFGYNQQIQLNLSSGETQTLELSQVNGMKITGQGTLQLVCGSQGIQITESLVLGKQVKLVCDETIQLVGSGILQASSLNSNISIQGDWELTSDLILKPEKEVHFHNATINLSNFSIVSDNLIFSGVNLIHTDGGIIVANKSFLSNEQLEVESSQAEVIFIPELADFIGATDLPVHFFSSAANPCGDPEFEITVEVTSDYNGEDISCNGADDAELQCIVTGGVGPFVCEWFGGPGENTIGETYSGLGAGTYTVLVTDEGQDVICVENVQIAEPPPLAIFTLNLTLPPCVALCNGSTSPIVLGGTGAYSFEYSNGGTDQENLTLCAGENSLMISDVNNCQLDTSFVIEEDSIDINLMYTDSLCFGNNSGIASVSPSSGGGGPYDIEWSNSEVTNSISNLSEGIYSVEILYAEDCSIDSTFTLVGLGELIVTIDESESPVCVSDTTGIISVSISGGSPEYTLNWTKDGLPFSIEEDLSDLGIGLYELSVTDNFGCTGSLSLNLENQEEAIVEYTLIEIDCFENCNASITTTIIQAQEPITFTWSDVNGIISNANFIENICAGTYDLVVSDGNGCEYIETFIIEEPEEMEVLEDITNVSCNGLAEGSILLTVSGGSTPYSTSLPSTEPNPGEFLLDNLIAGTYTVDVTDDEGCVVSVPFDVTEPELLQVDLSFEDPICFGQPSGSITLIVSGGSAPYSIEWVELGVFDELSQSDLPSGDYNILITDTKGCEESLTVNLEGPLEITVVETINPVFCNGESTGSIELEVTNPIGNLNVLWVGNVINTSDLNQFNLQAGPYEVTLTDDNGCEYIETFIIEEPEEMEVLEDITNVSCNGLAEGSILLTVSGGSTPYSTSLPSTEPNPGEFLLDNLIAGTYTVDVTDDEGCVVSVPFDVTEPELLQVDLSFEDPICFGQPSGSITLIVSGGSAPYSIEWVELGVFDELSQSDLPSGDYNILITDTKGCEESLTVNLEGPLEITVVETINPVFCNGESTGSIELEVTNPIGNLNVLWVGNVINTSDLNQFNLQAGPYEVTLTDDNGCEFNGAYEILESPEFEVNETIINPLCFGEQGEISIEINGGQEPYEVSWAELEAPNQQTITDLPTGTYTVTVVDENLCEVTASYEITLSDEIIVTVEVTQPDCILQSGTIEIVNITGGTTPSGALNEYTIDWTGINAQGQTLVSELNLGEYAVTISDDSDCEVTEFFIIDESDLLEVTETVMPVFCFGGNEGSIELELFGATEPLDVVWTGEVANNSDLNQFNLSAGSYSLDILDGAGCNFSAIYEVTEGAEIEITELITQPGCPGTLGSIEITELTGGTNPYSFIWLEVDAPDQNLIENLESGDYTIQVTDNTNCIIQEVYTITEPGVIEVSSEVTDVLCNGANTGSMSVNIDSDNPIEDISWFDDGVLLTDGLINTIENLSSGMYSVEITDDQGCSVSETILISETEALLISADVSGVNCLGDSNGSILITVTGGLEPYTLTWSGPVEIANNQYSPANLTTGDYIASITDDEGCNASQEFSVLSPDSLSINETITNESCFGNGDGVIALELIGGTEPFTIDWIDSDVDLETLTNLSPGEYSVIITEGNGCQLIETYEVESTSQLVEEIEITNMCFGEPGTGAINILVAGEASSYSISWTGNGLVSDQTSITDLNEGCYTLEVLDANSCLYVEEICITSLDEIILNTSVIGNECFADEQGQIELEVSGGEPDYSVEWLNSDAEFVSDQLTVTQLATGVYTANITDNSGCMASTTASITSSPQLTAEVSETPIICFGDENGALDIVYSGGVGALTLNWTGPNGFTSEGDQNSDLDNGDYCYEVVDFIGCVISDCYALNDPDSLNLGQTVNIINCFGANDGAVSLEVSGGYAPYTAVWALNGAPFSTDEDISELAAGEYTLALSDSMGCVIADTFTVSELTQFTVNFDNIVGASCDISLDGAFEVTVSGGMLDYSYSWVLNGTEESTEEDPSELNAGDYQLTVTDGNECTTEIASVIIPVIGTVEIIVPENISWCFTEDLQLIEPISAVAESLEWTSPPSTDVLSTTSSVFFQEEPGVYELVLTGSDGPCVVTSIIEVTIYETPLADAGEDQEAELGDEVILGGNPTTEDLNTVVWTPSELLDESSLFNPSYLVENSIQNFVLTVTSPEGCINEDSTQVILYPEVDIHSGFTPNSDNINDFWVIGNLQNYPSIEVWIYNRWGEELFYSQGYNQPWDGTYNGNNLPIGTYYYVIDFNKPGFELTTDGPVTILR